MWRVHLFNLRLFLFILLRMINFLLFSWFLLFVLWFLWLFQRFFFDCWRNLFRLLLSFRLLLGINFMLFFWMILFFLFLMSTIFQFRSCCWLDLLFRSNRFWSLNFLLLVLAFIGLFLILLLYISWRNNFDSF